MKGHFTYAEESKNSTTFVYAQKYERLSAREHTHKLSQQDGLELWDVWDETARLCRA